MAVNKASTNFAFLRLLFAALVVLSHTAEIHDGNRSREPLTQIFGTLSFGEVAVAAFFFISGYLISGSFLSSKSVFDYLIKRVCRIYPAFIVAFFACVFIVAPLGGGLLTLTGVPSSAFHGPLYPVLLLFGAATLSQPPANMAFEGTFYPWLNGAMWTIPYEFRCYLVVALLGVLGLLRNKAFLIVSTAILLVLCFVFPEVYQPFNEGGNGHSSNSAVGKMLAQLVGSPKTSIRLFAVFMCGAVAQAYKEKLRFPAWAIGFSLVALVFGMTSAAFANVAIATFGGYLILALATLLAKPKLEGINPKSDISYGLYLYGWPVEKLIFWYFPNLNLVVAALLTLVIAAALGAMSWYLIEKRFVRLAGSFTSLNKRAHPPKYFPVDEGQVGKDST